MITGTMYDPVNDILYQVACEFTGPIQVFGLEFFIGIVLGALAGVIFWNVAKGGV